jgi:hypothetical protein
LMTILGRLRSRETIKAQIPTQGTPADTPSSGVGLPRKRHGDVLHQRNSDLQDF